MSKTSIPDVVKQLLFGRAAGRCEYRGCNRLLTSDDLGQRGKFSVFAHIVADEPGGPRGDPVRSPELADDINNLMLLCFDHHRLIDVDDVRGHPIDRLQAMKARHEERVLRLTELDDSHRTLLVLMAAGIGKRKGVVSVEEARTAVLPMYAPDDGVSIDLAPLRVRDGDPVAWDIGVREIELAASRVQERLAREGFRHISIFALAPIPLLMYLGRELGDLVPGESYQRHRAPLGWAWLPAEDSSSAFVVETKKAIRPSRDVSVIFSVSDEVDLKIVGRTAPKGPRYVVRVRAPKPDVVHSREQVHAFRSVVRELLLRIRERHGAGVTIHVFPALPNSLAVEFGRVLLPKADPHMVVYDFNRTLGGWSRALTLLPPLAPSVMPTSLSLRGHPSKTGDLSRGALVETPVHGSRFSRRTR